MTDTRITIKPAIGKQIVLAGGAVIAESANALELSEGDYPPVIYFPRDDVAMVFLDASEQRSTCPYKGEATYYSIAVKSGTIENAVWSYEKPIDAVSEIAGYLAFYSDRVKVQKA